MPAKAGIQSHRERFLDSRIRGNDNGGGGNDNGEDKGVIPQIREADCRGIQSRKKNV